MTDDRPKKAKSAHKTARPPEKGIAVRAAEQAAANPLALVAGGLTLGIVAGAVLPRSQRERELLAPVGERLGSGVTAAWSAAKDAGIAELDQAGISRDNAREQVRGLVETLVKAASAAGSAAVVAAGKSGR